MKAYTMKIVITLIYNGMLIINLRTEDTLGGIYYGVRRDDGEISGHQEVIWDFGNETSYPKAHKTIGYLTCQRLK